MGCKKVKVGRKIDMFQHFYEAHTSDELSLWGINKAILADEFAQERH